MKISIREWDRNDLPDILSAWLDYCRTAARSDMRLKPDCDRAMAQWLMRRYEGPSSIGYVADRDSRFVGFLIGRVDEWETVPPVLESRRIGIIDAVYVLEQLRRAGNCSAIDPAGRSKHASRQCCRRGNDLRSRQSGFGRDVARCRFRAVDGA